MYLCLRFSLRDARGTKKVIKLSNLKNDTVPWIRNIMCQMPNKSKMFLTGRWETDLHSTSWAVNRSEGREQSILLIRSFALSEIKGQGSDSKSITPFRTASNIPCCVSGKKIIFNSRNWLHHFYQKKKSSMYNRCITNWLHHAE